MPLQSGPRWRTRAAIFSAWSRSTGDGSRMSNMPTIPHMAATPIVAAGGNFTIGNLPEDLPAFFAIAQQFQCREPARRAHDAAAGMRARGAEIKSPDRRAIPCPASDRPHEKELIETELAVKYVAFGKAVFLLEVPRRHDLPVEDDVFQIGRVFGERVDHGVAEFFSHLRPARSEERRVGKEC